MNNSINLTLLDDVHDRYVARSRQQESGIGQEPAGVAGVASGANGILARLLNYEFDFDNPPTPEPCLLSINEVEMCHPGNVTSIEALQKAGKTAFIGGALASILAPGVGHLGWTSDGNPQEKTVLYFDTEQSRGHFDAAVRRTLRRAGIQGQPPGWFKSWALRMFSVAERNAALEATLEYCHREFGGIHSVWVDGSSELVNSVNDLEAAVALVAKLGQLAERYHCAIITVIHLNPGAHGEGGKSRGHLGSELYRKAETVLNLRKNGDDITTVTTPYTRGQPLDRSNPVEFRYDQTAGMHVLLTEEQVIQARAEENDLAAILTAVWGPDPEWTGRQIDVLGRIPDAIGRVSTKKRRLKQMEDAGWIHRPHGMYSLLPAGRSQVQPEVQATVEDNSPFREAA